MNETITTILWSAPLSAVLVTVLIWMVRSWLVERLGNSIRHEYNKDLEQHKAKLKAVFDAELEVSKAALKAQADAELEVHKANAQRLIHIDRSHFDLELESFQKLWSVASETVELTAQALRLYSSEELPAGKGEKHKSAVAADKSFSAAVKVVDELRPFIPRAIHERARALVVGCKSEIDHFFYSITLEELNDPSYDQEEAGRLAKLECEKLKEQWHELADAIQQRLQAIPGEQVKTERPASLRPGPSLQPTVSGGG